jgi:hypothetical protein
VGGPLDRTWFNALVDDTGSGTTGTIWNKAQLANELNAIDSALAPLAAGPASAVSGDVATFADTTGKLVSDSGLLASTLVKDTNYVDLAYNAANFTASPGTWTVSAANFVSFRYIVHGHVATVTIALTNTTIGGSPTTLFIQVPWTVTSPGGAGAFMSGTVPTLAYIDSGQTQIHLGHSDGSAWGAGSFWGLYLTLPLFI